MMSDKTFSSGRGVSAVSWCVAWCRSVSDLSGSSRARVCRIVSRRPASIRGVCARREWCSGVVVGQLRLDVVLREAALLRPLANRDQPEPRSIGNRDAQTRC
jgi:hypothetical protein